MCIGEFPTSRVNVLHIRDSGGFFGAEQVILTIAKNLNRKKFRVSLLCMDRGDRRSAMLENIARGCGIKVMSIPLKARLSPVGIKKIRTIIAKDDIDIVHTHDFKGDFYGLLGSLGTKAKRIATSHGSTRESALLRAYLNFSERVIYKFYHGVIAVSRTREKDLLDVGVSPHKLRLIENGLDLDLLKTYRRGKKDGVRIDVPVGHKVIGVVGRLFPDKGHKTLLQAFSKLLETEGNAVLLVVGDGPLRTELESKARNLSIEKKVHFCGIIDDMANVYESLDLLVIPSIREGLPYTLLEALAFGVPVVGTSVGGIPSVVRDGETGFLVRPNDSEELLSGMLRSLSDQSLARKMAQQGRQYVREKFSFERMIKNTEKAYLALIN